MCFWGFWEVEGFWGLRFRGFRVLGVGGFRVRRFVVWGLGLGGFRVQGFGRWWFRGLGILGVLGVLSV